MEGSYGSPANLLPRQFPAGDCRRDHLSVTVETHNLHSNGAGTTTLNLMFVAKQVDAHLTTTVIEAALDQDTQHGRLPSVNISNNRYPRLDDVVDRLWSLADDQLARQGRVLLIGRPDVDITTNIASHQQAAVGIDAGGRLLEARQGKFPVLLGKSHGIAIVLKSKVEQDFAVAIEQARIEVVRKEAHALVGGISFVEQDVLEAYGGAGLVVEAKLVDDVELVMLFGHGGVGGERLAAASLLLLYILGEVAKSLRADSESIVLAWRCRAFGQEMKDGAPTRPSGDPGEAAASRGAWEAFYRRNKSKRRIIRVAIRTDQAKSMRERFLGAVIEG